MTPLLHLRDIEAGYGGVQVLWGLSLEVAAGQVCCVLGPNGAGKTTMVKCVAGILDCWRGRVTFDGRDVTGASPEARARAGMAHVPQGRRVFPDMTVVDNLHVARFAAGDRADPETEAFVYELFPRLGDLRRSVAGRLSGGEQQMLAVGRALMAEPRLLILDEPSLGLAPVLVESLYEAIARIRQRRVAILLVEQMVDAALSVADTVVVLDNGRVGDRGSADDFREQDRIAQSYLGGAAPGAGT